MSILQTLEAAILEWLQPLGKQFNVGIEELTAYSLKRVIQHHQVYINYSNRSFEYPNFTDTPLVQNVSFDIFIRFLDLRSHDSAYPLLDAIVDRLRRFEPDEVQVIQPLAIASEKFLADMVDDGIWIYQQIWTIQIQNC
jgi:hypothetical protein